MDTAENLPERLLYSIPDTVHATGLSRSVIYEKIATGELGSVRVGARRLIPRAALESFVAGLIAGQ